MADKLSKTEKKLLRAIGLTPDWFIEKYGYKRWGNNGRQGWYGSRNRVKYQRIALDTIEKYKKAQE